MGGWNPKEQILAAGLWALPGPGARSLEKIIAAFGADVGAIVDRPFEEWLPGLTLPFQAGDVVLAAREAGVRTAAQSAERLFERCKKTNTQWTFLGEPAYPQLLSGVDRAPPMLFYRGPAAGVASRPRVAMVGTRKVEPAALLSAYGLAEELARSGFGVVSGAAEGIDTFCHRGALKAGGETWAFLGSSIDQVDPTPREVCLEMLAMGGTVFSDYPPGVRAEKATFPRRNRLIAGASDLTVVVRARHKSGALITAANALAQGRPLLAVPGDIGMSSSAGSNALLRDGKARACLGGHDVARALGLPDAMVLPRPRRVIVLPPDIGAEAKRVFEVLAGTPMDFDTLLAASGLSSGEVAAALTALELADAVLERPGRIYYRAQ